MVSQVNFETFYYFSYNIILFKYFEIFLEHCISLVWYYFLLHQLKTCLCYSGHNKSTAFIKLDT